MTEDADKRFNGLNLTAGIKVRKLLIELGIRAEDAGCFAGVKMKILGRSLLQPVKYFGENGHPSSLA